MAVKLRLARAGRKHVPFFRIVAIDSRKRRDGEVLATLGTYDALKSKLVCFNEEGIKYWIACGAQMTDSVKKICKKHRVSQSATLVS